MITKIRAQQLTFDLPVEGVDVWIRAIIQTIIKDNDYKTIQTIDRTGFLHRQMQNVALETTTFFDPITQQPQTMYCATLGAAISQFVKQWMIENNPDYHENEHGDLVKEG